MSTDPRPPRRSGRTPYLIVVLVLVILAAGGAAASLLQGPRLSSVQVDPERAITASGSRVVLTANQPLTKITEQQVEIEPRAAFTVDVSGRNVGVRFTRPLDDRTTYRIRIRDARGLGGGPSSELQTTFTTPAAPFLYLRRDSGSVDTLYRTHLGETGHGTAIFRHRQIEDYRATPNALIISVVTDGRAELIVTDLDGGHPRKVRLPGDGAVTGLRVSDRSDTFGYLFTDRSLSEEQGRISQLFLGSVRNPQTAPRPVTVQGDAPSMSAWQFIPDSESLLFIDFTGRLMLSDTEKPSPASLGNAVRILGVSRGTYTAIVERPAGMVRVDLKTGQDAPLSPLRTDTPASVESVVPLADDVLLWSVTARDADTMPIEGQLVLGDDKGNRTVLTSPAKSPILGVCPSPSGSYLAVTIAPNYADSSSDLHLSPMPNRILTRVVRVSDGTELADYNGFDASWCSAGPF